MESRSCTPCSWGHAGQGPLSGLSVQGVFLSNEYGRIRAERDGRKLAPEDWMNEHYTMMGGVFETEISDTEEYCEMKMHYCPLLEEWKKMGLSPEDQDLFCDVAMELDRNRAKEHGIPCDIVERLGKGDPFCRVVLWKKKKD